MRVATTMVRWRRRPLVPTLFDAPDVAVDEFLLTTQQLRLGHGRRRRGREAFLHQLTLDGFDAALKVRIDQDFPWCLRLLLRDERARWRHRSWLWNKEALAAGRWNWRSLLHEEGLTLGWECTRWTRHLRRSLLWKWHWR